MAEEKKFSIDNQYELDELKAFINNVSDNLKVTITYSEIDEKKPLCVLDGTLTKDEINKFITERKSALHSIGQKDALTGVYNSEYFDRRVSTIDRSQVIPVAVINVNINDWKFVNDNYGDTESDRLIKIVADILVSESKPYFVIGRIDGDVFGVIIPMADQAEAEFYINNIKRRCLDYEDSILAPSIAVGVVYKTNVEENIENLMSDAEYEMFNDKFEIKNSPGYRERLEHGLNNN